MNQTQELFTDDATRFDAGTLPKVFNSEWRRLATVRECSISEVGGFIDAHYLRSRPAVVVLVLKMEVRGVPVGMIVFSIPPIETEKTFGGKTWELARLYLIDEMPKNAETFLIGKAIRYIKRNRKDVQHLVSYADPSQGHSGLIYKASNWIECGSTDSERKTPRHDYFDATGKKYGRRGNIPSGTIIEKRPRVQKLRFHFPLNP